MNQLLHTTLFARLPADIVFHILQYDGRFILRNGKIMSRISKEDSRYYTLDVWCCQFLHNPKRWVYSTIIDLPITRYKSYVFEIMNVNFMYDNEMVEGDVLEHNSAKYSGDDETQVPLGVEGIRGNSRERSSSEFVIRMIHFQRSDDDSDDDIEMLCEY